MEHDMRQKYQKIKTDIKDLEKFLIPSNYLVELLQQAKNYIRYIYEDHFNKNKFGCKICTDIFKEL